MRRLACYTILTDICVDYLRLHRGSEVRNFGDVFPTLTKYYFRALYGVYKMTQSMAQRLLIRAENAILEVQDDDEEEEEQCPQPDRAEEASTQEKATSTSRGQRPTRLDNLRARRPDEDDFGNELPDTPGGWREEWHI